MRAECTGADAFFDADDLAATEAIWGSGEEGVFGCVAGAGAGWGRFLGQGGVGLEFEGSDGGVLGWC